MAFFGAFGERAGYSLVDTRAAYLFYPVLHFSLDGRLSLAYGMTKEEVPATVYPHVFAATASRCGEITVSAATVARLYHRYGKRFYKHIPYPTAFALYDSRRGALYLGGMGGEKCYVEASGKHILFSSEADLLRAPTAVDILRFTLK